MTEVITQERFNHLVELADKALKEAEHCADAECYQAACVMAAVAAEAGLLAHACVFESEIRAAGLWKDVRKPRWTPAPFGWSLELLISIATKMGWLPIDDELEPDDEPAARLLGEVGDAIRFVKYMRNLAAHPGKYAYDTPKVGGLGLGQEEYEVVYGVTRTVFDHLYAALPEISKSGGT